MMLATAGLAPALPGMAAAFQDVPNAALLVRVLLTLPALSGAAAAPFACVVFQFRSGGLADFGCRFPFLLHLVAFVILLGVLVGIDEPRRRAQPPQSTAPERIAFPFTAIGLIYAVALLGIGAVFVL